LSARITTVRYFAMTTSVSAQKISDITPRTPSGVGGILFGVGRKHSRTA
jgi:hypothetical protein